MKAEKNSSRGCFDGYISSPRTPTYDQEEAANSLVNLYNKGQWFLILENIYVIKNCVIEIEDAFSKVDSAFGTGYDLVAHIMCKHKMITDDYNLIIATTSCKQSNNAAKGSCDNDSSLQNVGPIEHERLANTSLLLVSARKNAS